MHKTACLVFCIFLLALTATAQNAPAALDARIHPPFTFVAYGDIRFLDPTNTKDSDPVKRKQLVAQIAKEKPAFIVLTGDLVATGADRNQWAVYDRETAPLRKAGITIYPSLGNHDLRGDLQTALQNYFQRFPYLHESRWYTVRAGNVLLITLDSSMDQPRGEQMQWLNEQLDSIPSDVDFVVFNFHHPPYTHSREDMPGGGHSERAAEQSLGTMLERRQPNTRARFLVFSGHVHNYERYEHSGVTYVVTGGGGATPYEVPRESGDAYTDPGPTYHYNVVSVDRGKLSLRMMKLEGGKFVERDSFTLTAKAARAAAGQR